VRIYFLPTEILIKFLKTFVYFLVCLPKMCFCFLFYHKVGGIFAKKMRNFFTVFSLEFYKNIFKHFSWKNSRRLCS
jgi:hypothetical protein